MSKIQKRMKKLKELLDDIFSQYIRLRDSNSDGIGKCISCNKPVHWTQADNGHYINRQHMNTRYAHENCNLQCRTCNRTLSGNIDEYKIGLIKKYGIGIHNKLNQAKHQALHLNSVDYREKIMYYKSLVKKMKYCKLKSK